MGDHTGAAITEVKVTALAANRAASVIRLPSGNMKITMWDVLDYGRQVIEKGSVQAEIVHDLAVDALSSSRLVTAVRTAGGDLRVIVWETLDGGATVSRRGEQDAGPVEEVSLITISSRRFATAVRAQRGVFRLILWEVSSDGLTLSQLSEASAGTASSISAIALSQTRLATAFRASEGTLKVIMWELLDDGATIDRRGEASADMIKQVVAIKTANPAFVTAMQTAGGDLKALGWDVSEDGEVVTQTLEVNAGQIQGLVGTAFDDDGFVTAVITEQGSFRNILWRPPKDGEPANFVRIGEREAGTTDRLSIDYMGEGLIFSGVRTESGELKVIAWWIGSGSGNSLFILHGDCRVIYAHFKDGSVNPSIAYPGAVVTKGQYLARMGNSGTSTGPHTHIHAERVSSFLSVQEIIQREAEGTLSLLGFRPIPFHCARAKRLSAVQPGEDPASTFSTMQGHGAYFAQFAIRPSWVAEMYVDGSSDCLAPTGRKQCTQVGEYSFGGPFHTVTQALTSPACMIDQLFIRGGTYKESVTFNRSMTVRSYEGIAIIRY
jgi:hypothetical protein